MATESELQTNRILDALHGAVRALGDRLKAAEKRITTLEGLVYGDADRPVPGQEVTVDISPEPAPKIGSGGRGLHTGKLMPTSAKKKGKK
jgi:hypothetical protein